MSAFIGAMAFAVFVPVMVGAVFNALIEGLRGFLQEAG